MKNRDFTNKQIIIAMILVIVVGFVGIFTVLKLSEPKPETLKNGITSIPEEDLNAILVNDGYTEEDLKDMTNIEKEQAVLSNNDLRYEESANKLYSSTPDAKEYPEAESIALYEDLMDSFETRNFKYIVYKVNDILNLYNLTTEENLKIANLMSDANIMVNYEELDWEGKEMTLQAMRNPESFVIAVAQANPRRREAVVLDLNSYSVVSETLPVITGSRLVKKDSVEYKKVAGLLDNTRNVYRVDYSHGEYDEMYAYVLETHERVLRLAGVYTDKQYEVLRTVTWWIETGMDIDKGEY